MDENDRAAGDPDAVRALEENL
jgi:ribosomal protein S18 acetylase RimI-like enzyme